MQKNPMAPEVIGAICEWLSGLIIGFTPLLAHGILHIFAEPAHQWNDSWAGDLLFVSITNFGLSILTVFTRLSKGAIKLKQLDAHAYVAISLSLIFFLFAGMIYGLVTSGHARDLTTLPAVFILLGSTVASLYFEIFLALRTTA